MHFRLSTWDFISTVWDPFSDQKVSPRVVRKILLEAHRYTGPEALKDGIVDALAALGELYSMATEWANHWKAKARADVYGVLRGELVEPAVESFNGLSYVHSQPTLREL
jgi:enoyl-CoA hydratase/carnithine racemase